MNEVAVTDEVGVKDQLVKDVLTSIAQNCEGEVDFMSHVTLVYEVACSIVGVADEADFRTQLYPEAARILDSMEKDDG